MGRKENVRRPLVAANWKMYKTVEEARFFMEGFRPYLERLRGVEVVLCPPFTALESVVKEAEGSLIQVGGQDLFWEDEGAYTGEISGKMLAALGCRYVIIGHSERRGYFHETDAWVNKKVRAALRHGLRPIVCVGESLQQRETGQTEEVVRQQVRHAFQGLSPEEMDGIVVAYEPIWAIGTGKNATGEDANQVCTLIRQTVAELAGAEAAALLRVQYGGSVKPENAAEFARQPEIDGALVGGASLDPVKFAAIAEAFAR